MGRLGKLHAAGTGHVPFWYTETAILKRMQSTILRSWSFSGLRKAGIWWLEGGSVTGAVFVP